MKKAPKSVADFRAAHDANVIVPAKIRKALADIAAEGPENWEYESDLIKRADVSQTQMGQFREHFAPHIVEAPSTNKRAARRVWFGNAKIAAKVRGE
jgi:guanyl-specific ribonuclease Sa